MEFNSQISHGLSQISDSHILFTLGLDFSNEVYKRPHGLQHTKYLGLVLVVSREG